MKKFIITLSIVLFSISYGIVFIYGKENSINVKYMENMSIKYDDEILTCTESYQDEYIHLDIVSKKSGKTKIIIEGDEVTDNKTERKIIERKIFVHKTGIITVGSYFGKCRGDISFIISFYIIIITVIIYLIKKYRQGVKNNLYSYSNARILGLVLFATITTIVDIFFFIYDYLLSEYHKSVSFFITTLTEDIGIFLILVFPIAFVLTILMTISNIKLLKEEGKRWTNMLGTLLGSFICLATLGVFFFESLRVSFNIVFTTISYIFAVFIAYLECIFMGICILGIKAARHIPQFDKDAILILGCKIKKDGTLTNLLKGRVDRAIEFSKMQEEKTNKTVLFVPSGGKGDDETISEAQAMKNYLIKQGIEEEKILIENKSKNTFENIKFSNMIVEKKIKNAKLAFSTTNYHVLRAVIIAKEQNLDIEGIGAKTKTYYWVNAFIREFVATLVSERKNNFKILVILIIIVIILSLMIFV